MDDKPIAVDPDVFLPKDASLEDGQSETTSIGSSIHRGILANGRRYQALSAKDYIIPSDEQQFESYEAGHLVTLMLDLDRENPFFRAPIVDSLQNILDIGTGKGSWAIDVADMFPETSVRGVDLYPPPVTWMPPNCTLEVDDVLQEWTWTEKFDLIHLRNMVGSFSEHDWEIVYKRCYNGLKPGGWIEQLESSPHIEADDESIKPDSQLKTWGDNMISCGTKAGRACDTMNTMAAAIQKTGFVDVHERNYKRPIGPWPRDKQLKEAGMVNYEHWSRGLEGWGMWLLTNFGSPHAWTKEEVQVYVAKLRNELKDPRCHPYHRSRRVWARKPMPDEVQ
ncbi:hypothetical protein N7474_002229 [Penicillium riverlandense]|uniref:uncharacterized protein n=1 Tax=Penicillium riverlandense TaxID=1903569 RepID=UPI002549A17B|nr:uncharacterized protein N7474_002229 [Penicillium riverlandense]KAJ5833918.1 hypothetical protein N7474_002229 [Penicillium riverlandense]